MKAVMKQEAAANKVGNIKVPNHPMYKRLSVLVIQLENLSHVEARSPSFLARSTGERELASSCELLILASMADSVVRSAGTKLRGDVRCCVEATRGTVKASD